MWVIETSSTVVNGDFILKILKARGLSDHVIWNAAESETLRLLPPLGSPSAGSRTFAI